MTMWRRAYVGIGANLGNKQNTIAASCRLMAQLPEVADFAVSSLWKTSPVGVGPQEDYLNGVCSFNTTLSPTMLFWHLAGIEHKLGRTEKGNGAPRSIDLDLLLIEQCHLQSRSLTLPHPRMLERLFVLLPLSEILNTGGYLEIPCSIGTQKVNINDQIQRLQETTDQRAEKLLSAQELLQHKRF